MMPACTPGCGCVDAVNAVQDPPLLYNLDIDPQERLLRDPATDPVAAAALAVIIAERDKHLAEIVYAPSAVDTRYASAEMAGSAVTRSNGP